MINVISKRGLLYTWELGIYVGMIGKIKQREVAGGDSAGNTHESHAHTDWAATPWGPFFARVQKW